MRFYAFLAACAVFLHVAPAYAISAAYKTAGNKEKNELRCWEQLTLATARAKQEYLTKLKNCSDSSIQDIQADKSEIEPPMQIVKHLAMQLPRSRKFMHTSDLFLALSNHLDYIESQTEEAKAKSENCHVSLTADYEKKLNAANTIAIQCISVLSGPASTITPPAIAESSIPAKSQAD